MRDYGKVHTSFWTSSNIRELSEDGRALAIYLLTCPHGTIAGVFRLPDGYACEDLQWTAERVKTTLAELFTNGFATRCETTKWVWVTKHFEWNPPENPNQKKAAAKMAAQVPDLCAWRLDFIGKCAVYMGMDKAPDANPSATLPQPLPNQYQEQEQEQEKAPSPSALSTKGSRLPKDWELPTEWKDWAQGDRADLDCQTTADTFRDYWVSKPGKDGVKLDWQATWRNWVRSQKTPTGRQAAAPQRASFV